MGAAVVGAAVVGAAVVGAAVVGASVVAGPRPHTHICKSIANIVRTANID